MGKCDFFAILRNITDHAVITTFVLSGKLSFIITNPQGLCAHPVLIGFQFPLQLTMLDLVLFGFSAPRVLNSLPVSIREFRSLPTFRRHLKAFLS